MKRTSKKVQMICATIIMVMGTSGMNVSASAAEKTKNFKLLSGDGMTLFNYVDVRTEEIVIDERKEAVTYYIVDENTKISFNVTDGHNIGGDIIQSEQVGEKEYWTSAAYYLGDSWGWPEDYPALSAFEFSYLVGDKEHTDYSPLAGVSMINYDSMVQTSDAVNTAMDFIEVFMMRQGDSASSTKSDNIPVVKEETKPDGKVEALPTASNIIVNDKKIAFDAYTIKGNNYFKLRDLAYALNGTEKQFEVSWDKANNAIMLTSGVPYTTVGSELAGKGAGNNISSVPTSSKILLDGKEIALNAYIINGNSYFKLRDMGQLVNFNVTWDSTKNTIIIDPNSEYTEQTNITKPVEKQIASETLGNQKKIEGWEIISEDKVNKTITYKVHPSDTPEEKQQFINNSRKLNPNATEEELENVYSILNTTILTVPSEIPSLEGDLNNDGALDIWEMEKLYKG